MGAIVIVLAIAGFFVLSAYLKFPPPYANKKMVAVYDKMVIGVCVVICFMWFLDIRVSWVNTTYDKLWLPVAIAGALAIETVFLGICFLLRNFWVFRPPRRPGGGFGF